jgi:hypothetical protein
MVDQANWLSGELNAARSDARRQQEMAKLEREKLMGWLNLSQFINY